MAGCKIQERKKKARRSILEMIVGERDWRGMIMSLGLSRRDTPFLSLSPPPLHEMAGTQIVMGSQMAGIEERWAIETSALTSYFLIFHYIQDTVSLKIDQL